MWHQQMSTWAAICRPEGSFIMPLIDSSLFITWCKVMVRRHRWVSQVHDQLARGCELMVWEAKDIRTESAHEPQSFVALDSANGHSLSHGSAVA